MTMDQRVNICLSSELLAALKAYAAARSLNLSQATRLIIERVVNMPEFYKAPALPNWQVEAWTALLRGLFGDDRLILTDEVEALLAEAVDALDERSAEVLRLRFGLDGPRHTLRETAAAFGWADRGRAHQMEVKALQKMRYLLRQSGIWELIEPQLEKEHPR